MIVQLLVLAVIIWQGSGLIFLGKKIIEAQRRREEIKRLLRLAELEAAIAEAEAEIIESQGIKKSEERLAKESNGQRKTHALCSLCCYCPTTIRCSRCKVARYCSGNCQIKHWRQGHKYECVEAKGSHETNETRNDEQSSMPDATINNSFDPISFIWEDILGSASEEENTNPNPLTESSEDATKKALEQSEERVTLLEEELTNSKKEISLLKSECNNWSARTGFVSRRLGSLMRESDESQIAEQAKTAERRKQNQHLEMLKSECEKARRELIEEKERVRRLKLEVEEITRNFKRKVEEVRVAERRKQEKYIQMLEVAKEARTAEGIKQEENIQLLKTECVNLRRELEQERMQRLQQEHEEGLQAAKRNAERLTQELANARKSVEYAENGWVKALRDLEEEREVVRLLQMECEETRQSSMRQMEEKELELANAINAAAAAEAKLSDLEREVNSLDDKACAICLTNEMDVAFGCGHMTCGDCMLTISNCHICREPITSRLKLFPG